MTYTANKRDTLPCECCGDDVMIILMRLSQDGWSWICPECRRDERATLTDRLHHEEEEQQHGR